MSTVVDERVVSMQFDNKNFESNVQTSLRSIEKLKESLNFKGITNGLEDIDASVKNLDMGNLASAIENVGEKFSIMQVIAISALDTITRKIVNAGIEMAKSLSVDQLTAGWGKYGDKVTSVQTIMSATAQTWEETAKNLEFEGTQMEFVSSQLEKLNWFSDETSYSFTDMTNNIGKFTSNGVALNDAVQAMEGISTWAAKSGQNTESASRAMYNLAQAISVGSVKLIDWKSIENANMATTEFKQTAIDTALAMGTLKKAEDGTLRTTKNNVVSVTNFNEALQDSWFTSEVLMETLNKYGKASVRLSEIYDEYGITASQFLSGMDDFNEGNKDINSIAKKLGITAEELKPLFEELSSAEYELGLASFRAAQEAKTFQEAIDATKDAVSTGWMNTFELIFGNYEEAKVLWTDMANALWEVFAASGETRNEILAIWNENGGRDDLIDAFWNLWDAIDSLIAPIKEAFGEIFPSTVEMAAEKLYFFTRNLANLTEKMKISDKTAFKIKNTFKGVFAVLDIGKQLLSAIVGGIKRLLKPMFSLDLGILDATSSFGEFLVSVDETIKKTANFQVAVNKVVDFLISIPSKIDDAFQKFTGVTIGSVMEKIQNGVVSTYETIKETILEFGSIDISPIDEFGFKSAKSFSPLTAIFNAVKTVLGGMISIFSKLFPLFAKMGSIIGNTFTKIGSTISEAILNSDVHDLFDLINSGILVTIGLGISKFINSLTKALPNNASSFIDAIKDVMDNVGDTFKSFQDKLKSESLKNIAIAIAILAASLYVLSTIDASKLAMATGAITTMFVELIGSMKQMSAFEKFNYGGISKSLILMSVSVLILASACKKIASLDNEQLLGGILGISALMKALTVAANDINGSAGKITKGATALIAFGVAIRILTSAVVTLGKIPLNELIKGITSTIVLIAALSLALTEANFKKISLSSGLGIVLLAAALNIMAKAIKSIGEIDLPAMIKGLVAIGVILAELAIASKFMSKLSILSGAGLVIMAAGVVIMAKALKMMGDLDINQIAKGLIAMGVALAEITVASKMMSKLSVLLGAGLVVMAAGLVVLAKALEMFGNLSIAQIAKGLITMAASMAILVVSAKAMVLAIPGALALTIMSVALLTLSRALKVMGSMSIAEIGKSLLALASSMLIIGVVGGALGLVSPLILAFAAAVTLLGIGLTAVGGGMLMFSAGLATLAVSGVAGILAFVTIIETLIGLVPGVATAFAKGLLTFIETIGKGGPIIFEAVKNIGISFLQAIKEILLEAIKMVDDIFAELANRLPNILRNLWSIVITTAEEFAKNIYPLLVAIIDGIINSIKAISDKLPELIQVGVDLILSFINGMADAIDNNAERVRDAFIKLFKSMLRAVCTFLGIETDSSSTFKDLAIALINGLIDGLTSLIKTLIDVVKSIFTKIVNTVKEYGPKIIQEAKDLVKKIIDKIKEKINDFKEVGKNLIEGFINGITGKVGDAINAVKDFAGNIIDKVKEKFDTHSPSKVFEEIGKNLDQGLARGVNKYSDTAENAAEDMGTSVIDRMKESLRGVSAFLTDGIDASPQIRPVIDLTDVNNGVHSIDKMFKNQRALSLASNIDISKASVTGRMSDILGNAQDKFMSRNEDFMSSINDLIEHISNIVGDDDKEVALYVDGKKLASSIAKPMNRELNILLQRGAN